MANNGLSISTATPHNQSAFSGNSASPNHAAPAFDTYRNNPVSYVQAAEQYFARNAAGLHQHLMEQSPEAQKALLDHSQLLRDYLGIGNPRALRKMLPSSSSAPVIPYSDAPAALALAATRVTAGSRVDRSLDALAKVLEENQRGSESDTREKYKKSVEAAFVHLLNDFGSLPSDVARGNVIAMIRGEFNQLSSAAREKIRLAMQQPLSDSGISNDLKNSLRALDIPASTLPPIPTEIHLNILDKLQELAAEDARANDPDITQDQASRAASRAMAKIQLVSRSFQNIVQRAVNVHPDVGAETTANAINNFSRLDNKTFKQKIVDLFSRNYHIGIDFSALPEDKKHVVLDVIAKTNHLRNVTLRGITPDRGNHR
jgi:hypothetical protein